MDRNAPTSPEAPTTFQVHAEPKPKNLRPATSASATAAIACGWSPMDSLRSIHGNRSTHRRRTPCSCAAYSHVWPADASQLRTNEIHLRPIILSSVQLHQFEKGNMQHRGMHVHVHAACMALTRLRCVIDCLGLAHARILGRAPGAGIPWNQALKP